MENLKLFIGDIDSIPIGKEMGVEKHITTCVSFFAKSDNEAIEVAKKHKLKSFGELKGIKLSGRDF